MENETQPPDTAITGDASSAIKWAPTPRSTFAFSGWLFQRCLGIAYLSAFGSLASQITGLIGQNGILPIERVITYLHQAHESFFTLSSLAWFNSSDVFLQGICWAGVVASCLAIAGVTTPVPLVVCWLLWMSIVNIGQEFLSFQWDILLLEVGFLAISLAPWRLLDWPFRRHGRMQFSTPHVVSVWLFRWLLFRLMFESGVCKLASGDETWRSLTAMQYHYHTQPLPTPAAWFADKLPEVILKGCTLSTLIVELVVPFFILIPRLRTAAAVFLMLLQILIAATGNYAYFNLLTFALCFFLIDDGEWSKLGKFVLSFRAIRSPDGQSSQSDSPAPGDRSQGESQRQSQSRFQTRIKVMGVQRQQKIVAVCAAIFIAALSLGEMAARQVGLPETLESALHVAQRFYFVNSYGLFATMTTTRDEIIIEGSSNGTEWKQYEFNYKPGNVFMPPCIVAPCQPRLDWQMWFAALGDISQSPWFGHFMVRLFNNSPEVLHLLKTNPFPEKPPDYLRARLYRYSFSDWKELSSQGQWWRSEYRGEFMPEVSSDGTRR